MGLRKIVYKDFENPVVGILLTIPFFILGAAVAFIVGSVLGFGDPDTLLQATYETVVSTILLVTVVAIGMNWLIDRGV